MQIRDTLIRETRHAARALRRTPSFSAMTLVTLALGIGAATAIFTLLDAVVIRPLPYPNADRLVALSSPVPKLKGQTVWGLARHEMYYFLEQGHSLTKLGVYQMSDITVLGGGGAGTRPERVHWVQASASLLSVLGFRPERGRLLTADDNRGAAPTVVMLSHGYWARRFGSDPDVVGKTIDIEGFPMTIVGVLPPGADLPDLTIDVWAPAHVDSTTVYNNHTWSAIGLLKPGWTAKAAQRDLTPLTMRLPEVFPKVYGPTWNASTGFSTRVVSLRDDVVGNVLTRALWTLFGAVALVLLMAAANVANLFLVRLDARRRERALRTALGADRAHLAWHYLSESMLLAVAAGTAAVAVAWGLLRMLLAAAPSSLPRLSEVRLGAAGVGFAVCAALASGLAFGVLPLFGRGLSLTMLRDAGRGLTTSKRGMAARRVLVASQMALAVVLLAGATLMVRTFRNLRAVQPGFDATGVLTMDIALPEQRYGTSGTPYNQAVALTSGFYEQVATRLRAVPGVSRVGFTDRLPLASGDWCTGINIIGETPESTTGTCPPSTTVSPGYFETMGIPVTGRTLDWAGMDAHDGAVVVSKAFADHHWPTESPIGKHVSFRGTKPPYYTVVGEAADVRGMGVDAPPPEYIYFPVLPIPDSPLWGPATYMHLVLRTGAVDPLSLTSTVTRIVQEIEPQAAVANVATEETLLAKSMARQSFTMVLLLVSAGSAMLLSAVGIYGVITYIVTQRRGEIGVRIALGARGAQVTSLVLRQSLALAAVGLGVGVAGAWGATRALSALLFGVRPSDPLTLAAVPVALLVVAALASWAPAHRASRIDPAEALRSE
jgi:putative ABC transport system permease protein